MQTRSIVESVDQSFLSDSQLIFDITVENRIYFYGKHSFNKGVRFWGLAARDKGKDSMKPTPNPHFQEVDFILFSPIAMLASRPVGRGCCGEYFVLVFKCA
jgi:hypothetical protein